MSATVTCMCGIVGFAGSRPALSIVLDGLRRLEYRGYDSAGVAIINGELLTAKRAGKLANLEKALADEHAPALATGTTGIGHTRWATHGGPTDRNAHPHLSADGRIAVIHNGIIENFARLRAEIEASGVEFASETDTECVAHLLAAELARIETEGPGAARVGARRGGRAGGRGGRGACGARGSRRQGHQARAYRRSWRIRCRNRCQWRARRGHAAGLRSPGGRVHAARRTDGDARGGGRRAAQLPAGR